MSKLINFFKNIVNDDNPNSIRNLMVIFLLFLFIVTGITACLIKNPFMAILIPLLTLPSLGIIVMSVAPIKWIISIWRKS